MGFGIHIGLLVRYLWWEMDKKIFSFFSTKSILMKKKRNSKQLFLFFALKETRTNAIKCGCTYVWIVLTLMTVHRRYCVRLVRQRILWLSLLPWYGECFALFRSLYSISLCTHHWQLTHIPLNLCPLSIAMQMKIVYDILVDFLRLVWPISKFVVANSWCAVQLLPNEVEHIVLRLMTYPEYHHPIPFRLCAIQWPKQIKLNKWKQ